MDNNIANYRLNIIVAAVKEGFEIDIDESFSNVFDAAYNFLMDNATDIKFLHVHFYAKGHNQSYTFVDDATGMIKDCCGELFDFATHENNVFFHENEEGMLVPVKWFDVPIEGEARKKYMFVFDKEILSDGTVVNLYDYLK